MIQFVTHTMCSVSMHCCSDAMRCHAMRSFVCLLLFTHCSTPNSLFLRLFHWKATNAHTLYFTSYAASNFKQSLLTSDIFISMLKWYTNVHNPQFERALQTHFLVLRIQLTFSLCFMVQLSNLNTFFVSRQRIFRFVAPPFVSDWWKIRDAFIYTITSQKWQSIFLWANARHIVTVCHRLSTQNKLASILYTHVRHIFTW